MIERRIIDYWESLLKRAPDERALRGPDGNALSRSELDRWAADRGDRLRSGGLRPGSVLLACLPNGPEWLSVFLACGRAGVVSVFADPGTNPEELERIARSLGIGHCWSDTGLGRIEGVKPRHFRPGRIVLGKLTSGSTGLPKCNYFTDAEMLADGRGTSDAYGYGESDLIFGLIPWGHSYGLGSVILPFILLGCPICWPESPMPGEIERCFASGGPTVFPAVPTVLKALAQSECDPAAFRSLRVVITAGARLDPAIARAFRERYGVSPRSLYGSSETGSICADPTGELTERGTGVGVALPEVKLSVSPTGRLRIAGPAVYTYRNRTTDTRGYGVCLTGDYGRIDSKGVVTLEARAKGFVKVGERRVGLADVERRLEALPGVTGAHAVALERAGTVVVAAALESSADRKELARAMRSCLPARFRPSVWIAAPTLPMTPRGKRDDRRIREQLARMVAG